MAQGSDGRLLHRVVGLAGVPVAFLALCHWEEASWCAPGCALWVEGRHSPALNGARKGVLCCIFIALDPAPPMHKPRSPKCTRSVWSAGFRAMNLATHCGNGSSRYRCQTPMHRRGTVSHNSRQGSTEATRNPIRKTDPQTQTRRCVHTHDCARAHTQTRTFIYTHSTNRPAHTQAPTQADTHARTNASPPTPPHTAVNKQTSTKAKSERESPRQLVIKQDRGRRKNWILYLQRQKASTPLYTPAARCGYPRRSQQAERLLHTIGSSGLSRSDCVNLQVHGQALRLRSWCLRGTPTTGNEHWCIAA